MKERVELIEALSLVLRPADAQRRVDVFAHELAEKIRLCRDETRGAVQATKVVDFCADLIDPYMSRVDSTSSPGTGRDQP